MAFASSPDVQTIYLATLMSGRKTTNMIERPQVSLLWDNRTGNTTDHGGGLLVTASGVAKLVESDEASIRECFLTKNPSMTTFLEGKDVGLFAVRVMNYEVVLGYDRPIHWDPTTDDPSEEGATSSRSK